MTIASVWKPVGIALFAAALAAGPARAADQVKPGKWEFHVEVAMPNMPKLPPGVQLPPGIQMGAGGMSVTRTSCVSEATPLPPDSRLPKPGDKNDQCKVEKMERSGGTMSWAVDCKTPQGVSRTEGTARYNGDTMEATFKSRTVQGSGAVTETTQHITGRYLGACDK